MKNLIEAIEENGTTEELKAKVAKNAQPLAEYLEENGFNSHSEIDMSCISDTIENDDNGRCYEVEADEYTCIAIVESGDSYYAKLSTNLGELQNWMSTKLYDLNETEIKENEFEN